MGVFSVRKTKEQFIADARAIHGNKYDYSKVEYEGNAKKVCIICPTHGEFLQRPNSHLSGHGCPFCKCDVYKNKVQSVGVNDTYGLSNTKVHKLWLGMLERCYSKSRQVKTPTYIGCSVCDEWLLFSNFKRWFDEHYVEGWHLDKDILVKGNKVYSPETCCFVPQEINGLLSKRQRFRGNYPIGVRKNYSTFVAECQVGNGRLKYYGFSTPEDAFEVYKQTKERHIKDVANKWRGKISDSVYQALYNYKVDIND